MYSTKLNNFNGMDRWYKQVGQQTPVTLSKRTPELPKTLPTHCCPEDAQGSHRGMVTPPNPHTPEPVTARTLKSIGLETKFMNVQKRTSKKKRERQKKKTNSFRAGSRQPLPPRHIPRLHPPVHRTDWPWASVTSPSNSWLCPQSSSFLLS